MASIVTPLFMLLEVLMETLIPYLMASIIDKVSMPVTSAISTASAD